MKLPEYALAKGIQFIPEGAGPDDNVEFGAGTTVFPFWNESFLPSHIKKILVEANKWKKPTEQHVMCVIGRHWVVVLKSQIKERR